MENACYLPAELIAPKPKASLSLRWVLLLLAFCLGPGLISAPAQAVNTVEAMAVQLSAEVRAAPPRIRLRWRQVNGQPDSYTIWRKEATASSWGTPLASLASGPAVHYSDNTAVVGTAYEYRIERGSNGSQGFASAGIGVPAIESRGTLVLVVANTHAAFLAAELERLQSDLVGDGWQVRRHDVAATATPPQVKALIKADYLAAPTQVKAVLLLGHVAVPYSGALNPDGHPEHFGAWPADVYYADMRGTWSDTQVNTTSARYPENRNVPGDGKFDRSTLPVGVDLQVGRVDLSNLSVFSQPEEELLQRYLHKNHRFRHRQVAVAERGLVDDELGYRGGEAFANNGWRNFTALLGQGSVTAGSYLTTLASQSHLMAYGCGTGGYSNIVGVANVSRFASQPVYSVFNLFFGSYFGDWNNPNNFLRGSIAGDGYTLTSCWAGRPNWFMQHMALGQPIGFATQLSQQGSVLYPSSMGSRGIHVALMGDPTLRLHTLAPATALTASSLNGQAVLRWTPSPEAVLGYYVYRASSPAGPFTRITAQAVTAATYTDPAPLGGPSTYMVRALQLQASGSGSYYNLSQGVFGSFSAPVAVATTWLGTVSSSWSTPANWNTGVVPGTLSEVTIPAGTPFSPQVDARFRVKRLTLGAGAQLTIAAGASLSVQHQPGMQPGSGSSATSVVLAAGTAATPGGLLEILEHSSPATGLALPLGTRMTVGDFAELRLLGSLDNAGGGLSFGRFGRLAFTSDPALPGQGLPHSIGGTAPLRVGVLAVTKAGETLALNSPVEVLSQVENQGRIETHDHLTLLASPGQQAILAPVAPAAGQGRTLGAYTGSVRVQVYVDGSRNTGLGYRHLSTPVLFARVGSLGTTAFTPLVNPRFNTAGNTVSPFPNVFSYEPARVGSGGIPGPVGFGQGWLSPESLNDPLAYGRGYAVNISGNTLLSFPGAVVTSSSPVSSPFTVSMPRSPNPASGWNLMGNPFVAPLDWDRLVGSGRLSNANTALYVFKSSGQYAGSYASYVPGVNGSPGIGLNGGTSVIPVGQGFFVLVNPSNSGTATSGSITFDVEDLLTVPDATAVQRTAADPRPRLMLSLHNPARSLAYQTAIYFQAGATAGLDAAYDATYLPGPGQALSLTSVGGVEAFSINGLPAFTGGEVLVPLQLSAGAAGQYELAVEALASLPAGYHAYLADAGTGTYTDLSQTPTVRVHLPANAVVGRYSVLFSPRARVLAAAPVSLAALVSLYPNPTRGSATVVVPQALRGPHPAPLALYNALGQRVWWGSPAPGAGGALLIPLAGCRAGVYTVQIPTAVGTVSRRLLVE